MSQANHVLILGITGFIGGTVFTAVKSAHPELTFSALIRDASVADTIRAAGATPVLDEDKDSIARAVEEAGVVLSCADGLNPELQKAILDGMRRRRHTEKGAGVLIHTSGTSSFLDGLREGKYVAGKVWNDVDPEDIKTATTNNEPAHSLVNSMIAASFEQDLYSYIIAPAGVYGVGTGPVRRTSVFVKMIAQLYLGTGSAFVIGEGSNLGGWIHVSDLASLYVRVFDQAITNIPPKTTPYERFFIGSGDLLPWKTVAEAFAKGLCHLGKLPSEEVTEGDVGSVPPWMAAVLSGNTLMKTEGGQKIGWKCSAPSLQECIEEDLRLAFAVD